MSTKRSYIEKTEDHIYFNLSIPHNDVTNPDGSPSLAVFSETRGEPVVERMSDYYIAIDRFSIPGRAIPIFVFDNTAHAYTVCLTYGGVDSYQDVVFTPESNKNTTDPTYYYVYGYHSFINMVNKALLAAFNATVFVAVRPVDVTAAPYLTFDPQSELISLIAQTTYLRDTSTPPDPSSTNNVQIFFNNNLFNFFDNLQGKLYGFNTVNGKDFQIYTNNIYGNQIVIPIGAPGYSASPVGYGYENKQAFPCLYLWNDFRSIVILSSSMSIPYESIPTINANGTIVQNTKQSRQILSDFYPIINSG